MGLNMWRGEFRDLAAILRLKMFYAGDKDVR